MIELVVVVVVIVILSAVILFAVNQYIDKGKDSNIKGNLAILVAAGEKYYDGPGDNSYIGFCESDVVLRVRDQFPSNSCATNTSGDRWAACVKLFADNSKAYCVDSRGVKQEIDSSDCTYANMQFNEYKCQ